MSGISTVLWINLQIGNCARRDSCVHQRMNANVFFYYHMIYSPETNNQGKTSNYIHTIVVKLYTNKATVTIPQYYVTLCVVSS